MLECLIDEPHRSPEMAHSFRGRVSNWSPLESSLRAWRTAREGPELTGLRLPRVQGRTPNVSSVLEKVSLQSADTSAAITSYASRLRGVFSNINSQIRQCNVELQPLHAAWVAESNPARKADRRDDYNKVQNQAKQWHDVGKLVQKHYQEMVSRQLGVPPLGQPLEDCPIRLK